MTLVLAADARTEIADLLAALLLVYTIIIIAWIVASLVFSLGARIPYSRPVNAVLDFLRDVTEPYLRLFRRLPLRIGPLDLTPMVAIILLQIVGGLVIGAVRPGVTPAGVSTLRAGLVMVAVVALDQAVKAIVRSSIPRGGSEDVLPFLRIVNVRNSGVAFSMFSGGGTLLVVFAVIATIALLGFFFAHAERPLAWLPTGLLLGGAIGNLIDRMREGAVTDFVKFTAWPAFNVADIAITLGVVSLLYVLEGPPRTREREAAEAG